MDIAGIHGGPIDPAPVLQRNGVEKGKGEEIRGNDRRTNNDNDNDTVLRFLS